MRKQRKALVTTDLEKRDWCGLRLVLALDAPLHLGWRLTGNLQQTRRYVPGRALWGALTDRSCRRRSATTSTDFEQRGAALHENVRFTYAFVSDDPDSVSCWPWQDEADFDWRLLQSYASTALVAGSTSEAGSLHETEYLAPVTRDGKYVYLHLLLWYRSTTGGSISDFSELPDPAFWRGFQLGGERSYGWGRIQRAVTLEPQNNPFDWAGWNFAPAANGGIQVKSSSAASGPAALAHVRALESSGEACVWLGAVEPLLGRETVKRVPGRQVSKANICYCPGAVSLAPAGTTWSIGPYGIWQLPESSPQATD